MVTHLYPDFLEDERVYAQAVQHWLDLWKSIDPAMREGNRWEQPWFPALLPDVAEGNPIFSAYSPSLKRGIRVLQAEPTRDRVEFFAYMDTFGKINELIISCALSDAASDLAMDLMKPWVSGEAIPFDATMDTL